MGRSGRLKDGNAATASTTTQAEKECGGTMAAALRLVRQRRR
jgi:hypothetical protein